MTVTTPRAGIYCRISLSSNTGANKPNGKAQQGAQARPHRAVVNPVPKVETQEAMCRTLAAQHGYEVIGVYVDDGISAYSGKERPDWERLLADVQDCRLDVILAQAEDRFTRQPMEKEELALACVAAGVTWLTVNDGQVDPATADGQFFSGIRTLLGRMESHKMGTRKRQANAARRAKGVIPRGGPRPFGWEENRVTLRTSESELVKQALDDLTAGRRSASAIATAWNRQGVATTTGRRWDIPKVLAVLRRPRNAGLVFYEGEPLLSDDDEPIAPTWAPIVNEQMYRRALAVLDDPTRKTTKLHEPKYLTASLARCGTCGSPMRSAKNHRRAIYRCASHDGYGPKIEGMAHVMIGCDQLDRLVSEAVVSGVLIAPSGLVPDSDSDALKGLHVRLSEVRQAESRLLDLVNGAVFSVAEVAAKRNALRAEAEQIETETAAIAARSASAGLTSEAHRALAGDLSFTNAAKVKQILRQRFAELSLDQRRALVRGMLDVTVMPGRGPERVQVRHLVATGLNDEAEADVAL